jgi:hypothetical protein
MLSGGIGKEGKEVLSDVKFSQQLKSLQNG